MFKFEQPVNTPDGRGYILGRCLNYTKIKENEPLLEQLNTQGYAVTFRKKDFTEEEWKHLSPFDGPSIVKYYRESELTNG